MSFIPDKTVIISLKFASRPVYVPLAYCKSSKALLVIYSYSSNKRLLFFFLLAIVSYHNVHSQNAFPAVVFSACDLELDL